MKLLEAHNGLTALMVDKSKYDGIWVSSLTHSTALGLPDNELVSLRERVALVEEIKRFTNKPIVVDIDTGGSIEHLPQIIQMFDSAGVHAVVMEDKKFPKQNSLLEDGKHQLEDVDTFCEKIKIARHNCMEMMVIARLESLIAKHSKHEAIVRAEAYLQVGADGIMVHSKQQVDATEVMEVANDIRKNHKYAVLVAVPTTYKLPEEHPFDIVIEANQLMRASFKAMQNYIDGKEVELADVKEIFALLGH